MIDSMPPTCACWTCCRTTRRCPTRTWPQRAHLAGHGAAPGAAPGGRPASSSAAWRCCRPRHWARPERLVEITLTGRAPSTWRPSRQRAVADAAVQQCYRVSPGARLRAGAAGGRHGGLPRAGAAPVHAGRQRAQREGLLQRQARQVRPAQALEVLALGEGEVTGWSAARLPGAAACPSRRHRPPHPATIFWNSSRRCRRSTRT
jgi:hypothetical protein